MKEFNFADIFIYDMANNHQGDERHALNIITAFGEVTRDTEIRGALKFQFRQIETFIHPDYKDRTDVKHIPRFVSTALDKEQYRSLTQAVKENGMLIVRGYYADPESSSPLFGSLFVLGQLVFDPERDVLTISSLEKMVCESGFTEITRAPLTERSFIQISRIIL